MSLYTETELAEMIETVKSDFQHNLESDKRNISVYTKTRTILEKFDGLQISSIRKKLEKATGGELDTRFGMTHLDIEGLNILLSHNGILNMERLDELNTCYFSGALARVSEIENMPESLPVQIAELSLVHNKSREALNNLCSDHYKIVCSGKYLNGRK